MLRYPDVSLGRELLTISQAIFADPNEQVYIDTDYNGSPFGWQSSAEYKPRLKVLVPGIQEMNRAGLLVETAIMVITEDLTDYELRVEDEEADSIPDDDYNIDFLTAFRQYQPHPLLLSRSERIAARSILGSIV